MAMRNASLQRDPIVCPAPEISANKDCGTIWSRDGMPAISECDLALAQICCGTKRSANGPLGCSTDRAGREIAIADVRSKAEAEFLRLRSGADDCADTHVEALNWSRKMSSKKASGCG